MKVFILAKWKFDEMMNYMNINDSNVDQQNSIFISICAPSSDNSGIAMLSKESIFKEPHSNVKVMYFSDLGEKESQNNPNAFIKEQAKELYDFIKTNKDKRFAYVHCGGGISRSGAVGLFIFDNYGNYPYEEFKRKNPQIIPNARILRMLNEQKYHDTK